MPAGRERTVTMIGFFVHLLNERLTFERKFHNVDLHTKRSPLTQIAKYTAYLCVGTIKRTSMGIFDFIFGSPQQDSRRDDSSYRSSNCFITYDDSYFKNNDEDRAICEDMYGDRAQNHDTDLEFHYGWENKLNYDSDGYSDEEDW